MALARGTVLLWTPRIVGILYVLFLMMFSLDVFREGAGIREILLGLLMHNIPALILLGVILISWRMEWLAATVFGLAGILYVTGFCPEDLYAVIYIPVFVLSIFYWISWFSRKRSLKSQLQE